MDRRPDLQASSSKNQTFHFIDNRDLAASQLKMINAMRSSGSFKGNTIQRIKDPETMAAMQYSGPVMKRAIRKFLGIPETPEGIEQFNKYVNDDKDETYDHDVKFALNLVNYESVTAMGTALDMRQITKTKNIGGIALQIPKLVTKKVPAGGSLMSIYIVMPPIPMLGEGTIIGFIQVVQSNLVEGEAKKRRFEYEAREKDTKDAKGDTTPVATGWTIDRQGNPEPKNPFFGLNDDDSEGTGCRLGSDKDYAVLTDAPSCKDGKTWHPIFETYVIIKACPSYPALVNSVLTGVKWGGDGVVGSNFVWSDFEEQSTPSNNFISTIQVWNDYYAHVPEWKQVPPLKS